MHGPSLLLELDELLELELLLELDELPPLELDKPLLPLDKLLPELPELVLEPLELDGVLELDELEGGMVLELDPPLGLEELLELDPPWAELELLLGGTYELLELPDELLELDGGYCGGFSCPPHGGAQGGAQQLGGYGG